MRQTDKSNSMARESIFEVEKVVVEPLPERHRQHYPAYKIESFERTICKNLSQAEEALQRYVEKYREDHPKGWGKDVFCYYIKEYPLGVHITQSESWLLSWRMYDAEGKLTDQSVCSGLDAGNDHSEFLGRTADQIRFQKGDIVEFVWRDEVTLGFVISMPFTLAQVQERRERIINSMKEKGREWSDEQLATILALDNDDDSYIVLTTSDYVSHNHISSTSIFAPHYPVPNYMRKRLSASYQKYLKRYNVQWNNK